MRRNIKGFVFRVIKLLLAMGIFWGLKCVSPAIPLQEATFKDLVTVWVALMFVAFWIIEELGED